MDFNYKIDKKSNYAIVEMRGNILHKNQAEPMLDEVQSAVDSGVNQFVISMGEYKTLNSTAIGILVNILTKCRRSGGEATLLGVSEKNKDILNIVKLNSIFTITDDLPSAIRDFRSGM